MLSEQAGLRLERLIGHYLPGARADVTVQQLLTHTSGLDLQLSTLRESAPDALRARVLAAEPQVAAGTRLAYANINTLILGWIVEAVAGAGLADVLRELIFAPLGMDETQFCPPAALRERIAPTEIDETWRNALVHGVVHDESAYALGGVAGHAGVFAPAADITRYLQLWSCEGAHHGRQLLRPATIAAATRDYTAHLPAKIGPPVATGLGWMVERAQFMGTAAAGGYGHTGFTGPVMLVLSQSRLTVTVLSNRTYPQRTPPPFAHHGVTAALIDAVLRAM
jgi:CubicO group peptidase (beta-lactamase class C family)